MQTKHIVTTTCLALGLSACGGGGASGTNASQSASTTVQTVNISGTVPGTLIEAFCKDGSYYSTTSTKNGTSNHPFTLEVPKNVNCKLVMTTNETDPDPAKRIVTPIQLNDGNTSSTYFQLAQNSELGYVGLPLTGQGIQPLLQVSAIGTKLQINTFSFDPLDDDGDGIPNVYEDDDNDGQYNKDDDDDDNDGIKDSLDIDNKNDIDGDGIANIYDVDSNNTGTRNSTIQTNTNLPTLYTANTGRFYSAQCAQCHGTNGYSKNRWDSIAGESDLVGEVYDEALMSAQAKGYTNSELNLMSTYLKTLSKDSSHDHHSNDNDND